MVVHIHKLADGRWTISYKVKRNYRTLKSNRITTNGKWTRNILEETEMDKQNNGNKLTFARTS